MSEHEVSDFSKMQCTPCEGGVRPLDIEQVRRALAHLPGWETDGQEISRHFRFKDFFETMSFVNAAAHIANRQNHHPDLQVSYNTCTVRYSTHAIQGISENDLICAAKVQRLLDP